MTHEVRHSNLTILMSVALSLVSRNYCSWIWLSGKSRTICTRQFLIAVLSESSNLCQRLYQKLTTDFTYLNRFVQNLEPDELGHRVL